MEALGRWRAKHGDVFEEADKECRYHKARQQMHRSKIGLFGKIKSFIKYLLGRSE